MGTACAMHVLGFCVMNSYNFNIIYILYYKLNLICILSNIIHILDKTRAIHSIMYFYNS
jgi:hypothetical protein